MLRWSLSLGRILGIRISVHFTFGLLLAYAGYVGWGLDGGQSRGLVWGVAMLLCFFACVLLHELGHALTARRFGVRVPRICIYAIGGVAEFDSIPRDPRKEFLISIAGPAVNFLIAAALWPFVSFPAGWDTADALFSAPGLLRQVFATNLVMGCFNLVPVFPMDGGRIFRALLATRLSYLRATFWAATVGKVLAVVAIGLALFRWDLEMVAVLFAVIFVVGELEYRAVRYREREAAYMREALARLYGGAPPDGGPALSN